MPFSIGVIGFGRMAQAILSPLLEKGFFTTDEVLGVVGKKKTLERLRKEFPGDLAIFSSEDNSANQVWSLPIKLLAIKPQQLNTLRQDYSQRDFSDFSEKPLLRTGSNPAGT